MNEHHGQPVIDPELLDRVYIELRRLAETLIHNERANHTLQATALVHETYLRLVERDQAGWSTREHFVAAAAALMRRVLVDHARRKKAQKRGGSAPRFGYSESAAAAPAPAIDPVELDEALSRLSNLDPVQGRIVELRFFGGLTNDQVGELLGLSRRTVDAEWCTARAWLRRALSPRGSSNTESA